jgi:hypothetical protein
VPGETSSLYLCVTSIIPVMQENQGFRFLGGFARSGVGARGPESLIALDLFGDAED